jgi:hypothetical protein
LYQSGAGQTTRCPKYSDQLLPGTMIATFLQLSRYLKISEDISRYLKISQDISRYLKISEDL